MRNNGHRMGSLFMAIALFFNLAACSKQRNVVTADHDEFITDAERKALAALDALGDDGWSMDSRTEVLPFTLKNDQGDTVIYYACKTTYYDTDPPSNQELNVGAIRSVIAPEQAEGAEPRNINDYPGALYTKDGRRYLCWTISTEYTLIIEYTPGTVSEEDIIEMAESIEPDL